MKKYIMFLVAIIATLFAVNVFAFNPPPAPPHGGYVVDQAGKMSTSQIQRLNQKIDQISKSTKNEFGILLLPSMDGNNIEDVAHATFNSWGVGKHGLDNGCLIVVSIKERKSRIETGKGVEGDVPDLRAHDILINNLNPHLKKGDFYGGFNDTLDALSNLIESRHSQKAEPRPVNTVSLPTPNPTVSRTTPSTATGCAVAAIGSSSSDDGAFTILFLLGGLGLLGWFLTRKFKREKQLQIEEDLRKERERLTRLAIANKQRLEDEIRARKEREATLKFISNTNASPTTSPSSFPPPSISPPTTRPAVPRPNKKKAADHVPLQNIAAASAAAAAAAASAQALQDRLKKEAREAAEAAERKARQRAKAEREAREEEDRRRRRREESSSSSYSSSSSSSSFDWGSSSSSSDSGGFGGGDSGGGGSSSDW